MSDPSDTAEAKVRRFFLDPQVNGHQWNRMCFVLAFDYDALDARCRALEAALQRIAKGNDKGDPEFARAALTWGQK